MATEIKVRPIDRITKVFEDVEAILVMRFKSENPLGNQTIEIFNVKGKLFVLQDLKDERGSYRLYSKCNTIMVEEDVTTVLKAAL